MVGTTDLDHQEDIDQEATISAAELDYLLQVVHALFPDHQIGQEDVISTWSGVRPVIGSEKSTDPSKERRDHAVWVDAGLVTVSGGKLTTFRLIALDAIRAAAPTLGSVESQEPSDAIFSAPDITPADLGIENIRWAQRLIGRYGKHAKALLEQANEGESQLVGNTEFCLAECRWAARYESVLHLDDLLLRRTRLGLLLEQGGESLFAELEEICSRELQWDSDRWQIEAERYRKIWRKYYYLPVAEGRAENA